MTDLVATAGQSFYPEMGGSHDGTALFVASSTCDYIKWSPERHAEAMAAFKAVRARPRNISVYTTTNGARQWSASITYVAFNKLRPLIVREALLD